MNASPFRKSWHCFSQLNDSNEQMAKKTECFIVVASGGGAAAVREFGWCVVWYLFMYVYVYIGLYFLVCTQYAVICK